MKSPVEDEVVRQYFLQHTVNGLDDAYSRWELCSQPADTLGVFLRKFVSIDASEQNTSGFDSYFQRHSVNLGSLMAGL